MSMLLGLFLLVLGLLCRVIGGLITLEAKGLLLNLSRALVLRAVAQLPPEQQPRWRSELLADLDTYKDRPLAAMRHALRTAQWARRLAGEVPSGTDDSNEAARARLPGIAADVRELWSFRYVAGVFATVVGAVVMLAATSVSRYLVVLLALGMIAGVKALANRSSV